MAASVSERAAELRAVGWRFLLGRRGWVAKHAALLQPYLFHVEFDGVVRMAAQRQQSWDRNARERGIVCKSEDPAYRD